MKSRFVVGCMSGTSLDAIDAALVRINGAGLTLRTTPLRFASHPLGALNGPLRALASQQPITAGEVARLAHAFSLAHAGVIWEAAGDTPLDLISIHGQTVFHAPPVSWQLLTPAPISRVFGVPVVFDLRTADLAAGGQGAPITPIADWVLFRDARESRVILNLGGFANYSWLPAREIGDSATEKPHDAIRGGDICACNQLLDGLARRLINRSYDLEGAIAVSGSANAQLVSTIVQQLGDAHRGRSLGTAEEPRDLVAAIVERSTREAIPPADVLASAADAIAIAISKSLPACDRILLAGGGARNAALRARLTARTASPVQTTGEWGVPIEQREAVAMAILGALCEDRTPITLPQITGLSCTAPLAGLWAFSPHPLTAPATRRRADGTSQC